MKCRHRIQVKHLFMHTAYLVGAGQATSPERKSYRDLHNAAGTRLSNRSQCSPTSSLAEAVRRLAAVVPLLFRPGENAGIIPRATRCWGD